MLGRSLRTVAAYLLAAAFGAAAYALHIPLPWMLGPLIAAAVLAVGGFDFSAPQPLRRGGQLVIGATIGLTVTADVASSLPSWIGVVVVTALIAVLVGATLSVGFARLAGVDQKTAFFAMMPGGLSEMGNIGAAIGARAEPIAIVQAMRVALIVFLIPPLLLAASGALRSSLPQTDLLPPPHIGIILAVGLVAALLTRLLRMNNPWAIGPLVATAAMTSAGLVSGHMPPALFFAGQIFLGFAIGALFRRELLQHLPRVAAAASIFVVLALTIMAAFGLFLASMTELDAATAILSASPGGMAEMSATAQSLHIGAALVAVFHVGRAILVNAFATYYWTLLSRIGFFDGIGRMAGWIRRLF
jgi:uncharacterized protein